MKLWNKTPAQAEAPPAPKFPGIKAAKDGAAAVRAVERGVIDDLVTSPSESAAITAGSSMAGLRAAGFVNGPGALAMHESLFAAAGRPAAAGASGTRR